MAEKSSAKEQLKKKDKVSGKVIKTTLAGALVDIGLQKPAVIPISQLRKDPVRRVEEVLKEGDDVEAWVRRSSENSERIELTLIKPLGLEWREIKKGKNLKGKVSRIEKFGVFVDLGSERPGLVHVSEISHDYIRTPEDAVKVGDEVEVQVLDVDRRKKQIKLSMKALQPLQEAPVAVEEEKEDESAPTAMEAALRKAMDKEDEQPQTDKNTEAAPQMVSDDMEDILTRTLENRMKSK